MHDLLRAHDLAIYRSLDQDGITGRLLYSRKEVKYTSVAFSKRGEEMGVKPSMGTVGDAYDNAMAESFFAKLECELIDRRSWKTKTEARLAIFSGSSLGTTH